MDVLIHLKFDHREPAVTVNGQQIDDSAVAAGELRHLTVDRLRPERCVQRFQVGTHPPFKPRFRLSGSRRARLFSASIQPGVEIGVILRVDQLFIAGAVMDENQVPRCLRV